MKQHKVALIICIVSVILVGLFTALAESSHFIFWLLNEGTDRRDQLWKFAYELGYRGGLYSSGIWLLVCFFLYLALFKIRSTEKYSGKITLYIVVPITIIYCVLMFFNFNTLL